MITERPQSAKPTNFRKRNRSSGNPEDRFRFYFFLFVALALPVVHPWKISARLPGGPLYEQPPNLARRR